MAWKPKIRVLAVYGTRPEFIKLAPLISCLRKSAPKWEVRLLNTGQHDELQAGLPEWFGVVADSRAEGDWRDVDPDRPLDQLRSRLIPLIKREAPTLVLVQGDTLSSLAGALASVALDVPVLHVEAGLRSGDLREPWPEEGYRRRISQVAAWHAAPTSTDQRNLLDEGVPSSHIRVTGNTGIDALRITLYRLGRLDRASLAPPSSPYLLFTMHRRENLDHRLAQLTRLLSSLCTSFDLPLLFPVHSNPRVQAWANTLDFPGLKTCPPLQYPDFVAHLCAARLVISDSGGLQEECTFLQKPLYVLREKTERTDAVEKGAVLGMGLDTDNVLACIQNLLSHGTPIKNNPHLFGDGHASGVIVSWMKEILD